MKIEGQKEARDDLMDNVLRKYSYTGVEAWALHV